jgi:hypothetical protein
MNSHALPRRASAPNRGRVERRLHHRFFLSRMLTGQIESAAGEVLGTAVVQNLSARGVGLVCGHPSALGSELRIRLLNSSGTFSLIVAVRVIRCEAVLAGGHFLGCECIRSLNPGELRPFLA